jgi:cob(I)alamin adenosyltransferase
MPQPGLIQVYTGEGKGKTTAAIGLAVRALGQGLRVLLVRFLKPADPPSGEVLFLAGAPNLEILTAGQGILGSKLDTAAVAASVARTFTQARERLLSGTIDLAIFDEANNALHHGYLDLDEFLTLLEERPVHVEIVATGRNAPRQLLERADLVTRMEPVRHPLAAGIAARRGIEF